MRSRTSFFILLFAVSFLALPLLAHAANTIPFFGPIIDPKIMDPTCPLGWGAVIIVINNIILLLLTLAIVFVAPIMIAWSGFLFVVNPVRPEGKEQAKKILLNTVVGIVIALASWLIVSALMAVLYNPGASSGTTTLGKWSDIITSSGPQCLPQKGTEAGAQPTVAPPGVAVVSAPGPTIGTSGINISTAVAVLDANAVPSPGNGQCWKYVRQAIVAGGLRTFTANGTAAKDAGSLLADAGFTNLGSNNSSPQTGDVVIIQNYPGGSVAGHAAMYDGTKWVSDFVQADFWGGPGYRTNQPAHTFYRP